MTGVLDLPIVRALYKAFVQHEVWLAGLGCGGVLGKVNPEPHPAAGLGAPSSDVAEVLFHGTTARSWRQARMYERGLDSMHGQLPFAEAHALTLRWLKEAPCVSRGEVMRTIHMLKRAERLGLVVSERVYGRLCWRPA